MKKLISTAAILFTVFTATAQTKETYTLKSFPTYDSMGNYYEIVKTYDHIPTQQDSTAFRKESYLELSTLMDSVQKARIQPKKSKNKANKH